MNISSKTKKVLIATFLAIILIVASFGLINLVGATENPIYNGTNLEQNYAFGQKVTLPEGTIKYSGATKRAQVSTAFPSGKVVEENIIYLTEEGVYTVTFYATFNGVKKGVDQKFSVKKNLFTVQKETSSVEYATYKAEEHNRDGLDVNGQVSGAYVELSAGDTLTYNKVINLNGKTSLDSLVRVVITPSVMGEQDFGSLSIILTDAYNPKNYVTIYALGNEENAATYTKVAASNGQALSGWDYGGNRILSGSNPYGFATYCLFGGISARRASIDSIEKNYLDYAIDYEQKSIHATSNYNTKYPSMIGDLDNADDYGIVWDGFTTGECFLSISCGEYIGQSANFVVQSILGEQITSNGDFVREKPTLKVDYQSYSKVQLPQGQVNKQYKLFNVEYSSPYFSNLKLEQNVYFDYSGEKTPVEIVDGAFTPTKKGEYTVEVSVTDALEQKVVETYLVSVTDQELPIYVSVKGAQQTTGRAGEFIPICDIQTSGGSGEINVEFSVTLNGDSIEIINNAFFPTKPGDYKVKTVATDYLGNVKEYEYTVQISSAIEPVFIVEPIMPKYLISGNEYQMPEIYAKDYITSSDADVKAEILYKDAYGVKRAVNGKIKPVVRNNGDIVKIIYQAKIGNAVKNLEYEVPTIIVRENNEIQIERLFVANGTNVVSPTDSSYVEFRFFENTSYDFINPLAVNGIDVRFSADALGANYDKVIITLTDIYNQEQSLKLNYSLKGSKTEFTLNSQSTVYTAEKVLGRASNVMAFTIDTVNNELKYDTTSAKKVSLKTYANGKEYKGFDSGLVYMTFSFEGVKGISTFRVNNISGKFLEDAYDDLARPRIAILGNYGGNYMPGESVKLPTIVAVDVIDGILPVVMSATAPDGSYITDANGKLLYNVEVSNDHVIKLSDYGSYKVSLKVVDRDDNPNSTSFTYKVEYDKAPTILVEGVPTTGKVGEKIVVPTATVEHNALGGKVTLVTYLITDTGNMYTLTEPAFIPQRAGTYTVRYYCIDELGNYSMLNFDIKVA